MTFPDLVPRLAFTAWMLCGYMSITMGLDFQRCLAHMKVLAKDSEEWRVERLWADAIGTPMMVFNALFCVPGMIIFGRLAYLNYPW